LETTDDNYWFYPIPPFSRTGPGNALDGQPKFDLTKFGQAYFDRLRKRVIEARERGIYVSIMLFNGWSVAHPNGSHDEANPWHGHPYNANNNTTDFDGNPNSYDRGIGTHHLAIPAVTSLQEAYVRKVNGNGELPG
jgi:hypothetical protein